MIYPPHPRFVVHCVLSRIAIGCAEEDYVFDVGFAGTLHMTLHNLVDGDYYPSSYIFLKIIGRYG